MVIGISDGGNGLGECLAERVFAGRPQPIELILDFYHASEHVCAFASVWLDEEAASEEQAPAWCHTLKHAGGRVLLEELDSRDLADRPPSVREQHRLLCGDLGNNLSRTDDPRYRTNGWQIGSGTIESACQNVVNARLNGCGIRWSEPGTDALCHVRALFKSEPSAWCDYWANPPTNLTASIHRQSRHTPVACIRSMVNVGKGTLDVFRRNGNQCG